MNKVCTRCKVEKPVEAFYVNLLSRKPEARTARCIECLKAHYRERWKKRKAKSVGNFGVDEIKTLQARCLECNKNLGNSKHTRCRPCRSSLVCSGCGAKYEDGFKRFKVCRKCRPKDMR